MKNICLTIMVLCLLTVFLKPSESFSGNYQVQSPSPQAGYHTGIVFPVSSPEEQGLSSESIEEITDIIENYNGSGKIVGAELLIIKNRHTVCHRAFGCKDIDEKTEMKLNTIFNIRSMTKMLTGAAVQQLIDKDIIHLQDKVSLYIPGFDNEKSKAITIEQLLTHKSGLPLSILLKRKYTEFENLTDLANAIGEEGPEFEPGSKYWYSDSGADVLGAIVETVTGNTIDQYITEYFLAPLGMNDSFYLHNYHGSRLQDISSLHVGLQGNWSKIWKPGDTLFYPFAVGSQSLYSTPVDYARFLSMLMDNGMAGEQQLLSPEAVRRIVTPVSIMTSLGMDVEFPTTFSGLKVCYGQMSIIYTENDINGKPLIFGHSGSDGTYSWVWPEQNLMLLYFTQSRGTMTGISLEGQIDKLLVNPNAYTANDNGLQKTFAPYLGTYVANFANFRNQEFTVLIQNGRLAVDIPGQLVFELKEPDSEGKWYFEMTNEISVSFDKDTIGAVTGMKLHQAGYEFELPKGKAQPEVKLDPEAVRKLLGSYYDDEVDNEVEVLIKNNHLAIDVPGVMVFELYPPDENGLWACWTVPGMFIQFDEDENGNLVSFTRIVADKKRVCQKIVK